MLSLYEWQLREFGEEMNAQTAQTAQTPGQNQVPQVPQTPDTPEVAYAKKEIMRILKDSQVATGLAKVFSRLQHLNQVKKREILDLVVKNLMNPPSDEGPIQGISKSKVWNTVLQST